MIEKIKKYQQALLIALVVVCTGIIIFSGARYLVKLQDKLESNELQRVMDMTLLQKQSIDTFFFNDIERTHVYSEYLAQQPSTNLEDVQNLLALLGDENAEYGVTCLDEGWACSSMSRDVLQMSEAQLEEYRSLTENGARDNFIGVFSGKPRFSYYENFTFSNGHQGLIQKSYYRSTIAEVFNLSFYDGRGHCYILDTNGDILQRSDYIDEENIYTNIYELLKDIHYRKEDIDTIQTMLGTQETGSIILEGTDGKYVYAYTPLDSVDRWHLLSIVPMEVVSEQAGEILQDTQSMIGVVIFMLVLGLVMGLIFQKHNRDMADKDKKIEYQARLFDIFTTYISRKTDDVYMIMDHDTEALEYVSANAERVLGVKPEEIVNHLRDCDLAADPVAAREYYAKIQALAPDEESSLRGFELIHPKTGEHRHFLKNAYRVDVQNRRIRVAYISDRTKEQKIQASLTEALRLAEAANDAKSAFLSSISHDIRTPMNAIIGFLTLLKDEADNPDMVREYAGRIDSASEHLLSLINDVLDMNKIESGGTMLNISEMNLADIISEINTIIRPQAGAKGQDFDIFVTHMEYEHLIGDKMRINQILINLLSNAVKYTPENGAIQLSVEELPQVAKDYSRIRFTVTDNGLGMSEEYQKVMFDPFTREETKVTHEIQGTGLGMAITKKLVDLMNGTIKVESKLGEGSTFIVELELHIQEQEDDPKFWADHKVSKMIVADDDIDVCLGIVKTMAQTGVITDYTTNGPAAIQMMREHREAGQPYDIILLDWQMPNLNGLETARLIRQNYPDKIPILLLTAYDWNDIKQEAMEIGIDHFMPKPFFMSTFKEAIKRIMDSQKEHVIDQSDVVRDKHILVVDDLEVNRRILVKILGSLGASCDMVSNGQDAVEKFEASQPGEYDLILMDVQMPVMDGYTATRTIRAGKHPSAKTVPIIAMTANAFVDDVRRALASGMDAHIAKPVQMANLKATVQQVLDNRKKQ